MRIKYLVLAVSWLLVGCGAKPEPGAGGRNAQAPGAMPPTAVVTQIVQAQAWSDEIASVGTLSANESITISAKVTETIARINFKDGDEVRAGDILVELTGKAESAALREAQAAYREADKQYERFSNVTVQGTITRAQVDQQAALRDQAAARRDAIAARLSDRVIVAPFSGVLGFRMVSPGALVTPGTAITTLDDVRRLKLDFTVAELQLGSVKTGDSLSARSGAYPGVNFVGQVQSIDARVDPVTRSVPVRAMLDNANRALRPGMLMNVRLQTAARESLVINEIAVQQNGAQAFVFLLDGDGRAKKTMVKIGSRRTGLVEIVSGLSAGDVVITEGGLKLKDGGSVVAKAGG
jgi:membrane fusion protein, multidrug efflux system